jgi:hypothetical protein
MTDASITADIIPLRKRPKTGAERAAAYRARKAAAKADENARTPKTSAMEKPPSVPVTLSTGHVGHAQNAQDARLTSVTPVTPSRITPVTPSRPPASIMLMVAALALACVGVTMNAWFARSLGSTDIAGWLFLAVGVAADLAALALPSCAARFWQSRQRGTAAIGWLVWLATFAFAATAGIGFASVNISDVTMARASRVTPAVTTAQSALADAMAARDRECKGGVGKFCHVREQAVNDRRQSLEAAMHAVEQTADPQTEAARHIVVWLSFGQLTPSSDDFAMLRLVLLALLPQVGGVLLMLARTK